LRKKQEDLKMEFNDFMALVRDEIKKEMGEGYVLRLNEVLKNNGTKLKGINIMESGENISPTIYLDGYYSGYENGTLAIGDIVEDVLKTYTRNKVNGNVDMRYFLDYEKVKERIVYKLINTDANKELLEDVPHMEFLDLSIVFQCLVSKEESSTASILIHNSHMKLWNVSVEELYKTAMENTPKLQEYEIRDMNDIIRNVMTEGGFEGFCDMEEEELSESTPMYVLTNKSGIDGAACILYTDLLKDFASHIEKSFYVIPSSVHEVILVPTDDNTEADEIRRMIKDINDTQVKTEEVLSYSLYYFDRESGRLTVLEKTKRR
jgi:hypothetical protein